MENGVIENGVIENGVIVGLDPTIQGRGHRRH